MHHTALKARKGFTLTEAAIVLGVVGLILGGVWQAANAVRHKQQVNKVSTDILTLAENLRTTNGRPRFTSSSQLHISTAMISAGVIPTELVGDDGEAHHVWGGFLRIWREDEDTFSIRLLEVPSWACADLIVKVANGDPLGARRIFIAGAYVDVTEPVDVATAGGNTLCGRLTTAGLDSIPNLQFQFNLQ